MKRSIIFLGVFFLMITGLCPSLFSQQKFPIQQPLPTPSIPSPQPLPQPTVMKPPLITSFQVSRGAAVTRSRDVSLDNTALLASSYRASERPDFYGAQWMSYSPSPRFTLSPGDGQKTVYFQVKSAPGQISAVASDSITLTMSPIISSFTIKRWNVSYEDTGVSFISVQTQNTCLNNPTQHRISEKNDLSDANWNTYYPNVDIRINKGIGRRTIFYQTKNNSGVSDIVSAAIDIPARMLHTIVAGAYKSFAQSKGFYFGVKAGDVTSQCKHPNSVYYQAIRLECGGGVTGSRCDYTLFGNRLLNEGWKFKNYASRADVRSPDDGGYSVNQRPALDGRDITFKVHLWSVSLKKIEWNLDTLTLEGPGDASPYEAFK